LQEEMAQILNEISKFVVSLLVTFVQNPKLKCSAPNSNREG